MFVHRTFRCYSFPKSILVKNSKYSYFYIKIHLKLKFIKIGGLKLINQINKYFKN